MSHQSGDEVSNVKGYSISKEEQSIQAQLQAEKEQLAILHIQEGRLREAECTYQLLIEEGSKNYIVYGNLAALLGLRGQYSESISILKSALDLNPNYVDGYNNLGVAYKNEGNIKEALANYVKALEINPDHPSANNNLGLVYMENNHLALAISYFEKAIKAKDNFFEAYNNIGRALVK